MKRGRLEFCDCFKQVVFIVVHCKIPYLPALAQHVMFSEHAPNTLMMLLENGCNVDHFVWIDGSCVCLSLVIAFLKFSLPPVSEGVTVFDETGTEVDEEVFSDIAQQPNTGILTIKFDDGKIPLS